MYMDYIELVEKLLDENIDPADYALEAAEMITDMADIMKKHGISMKELDKGAKK